ncbi:helix-turn-helix domain-containing protein [Massilia sp. IC2-477]|uniref:helix-turn-helix domain-containing protein n=1 Tax=unclassified Massilia TaxID=2609279 RepID=UPI001D1005E1|nr:MULTISPECIES: helix-turn-helix domain-containing protein [unclassified Massilia]MCC2955493.1 helix-turn-helix domain-containing protein [Massilia sp. IC2-477]
MAGKMMGEEFGIDMVVTDAVGSELAAAAPSLNAPWPAAPHELRRLRIRKRESQEKFWSRFGVTQSSGSRFETGVVIPPPVAILLRLYVNGTLKDEDLHG